MTSYRSGPLAGILLATIAIGCDRQRRRPLFGMHRDKPPGLLDFAQRSIQYLVGFWLMAGLVLSVLVHTGILVWRDAKRSGPKRDAEALEASALAHKPASAKTPPPAAAVRY